MIRTVKPPPRVNPHGGPGRSPQPGTGAPAPMYSHPPDDMRDMEYRPAPSLADYGLDANFDFEAAVRDEMRKMEDELRAQVPRARPPLEEAPRYDVFEEPAPVDESHSIPFTVAYDRNGMFDSSIDHVVSSVGKDITSPGRRKGAAIASLYGDKDNRMNQKAAKAAEYAMFLQQQVFICSCIRFMRNCVSASD